MSASLRHGRWHEGAGRLRLAGLLAFLCVVGGFVAYEGAERTKLSMNHSFSFALSNLDLWTPYGGSWEVSDGVMQNASDERGAKLITGSEQWTDYLIDTDLQLTGSEGDAGLVVRVGDEETGVDSYRGYYIGLTAQPYKLPQTDNLLLIGKADHVYSEAVQMTVPGGVLPFEWYHLKVLAVGCRISAVVSHANGGAPLASVTTDDPDCTRAGKIGLRSYATGASWRNLSVHAATASDALAFAKEQRRVALVEEQPVSRSTQTEVATVLGTRSMLRPAKSHVGEPGGNNAAASVQPISDLRLAYNARQPVATVRGIVVGTTPGLYIEDSNAGIEVIQTIDRRFNLGDEVQATGVVQADPERLALRDAAVDLLWAGAPLAPVSVTTTQAAVDAKNPMLVQVKGRLLRKDHGSANSLVLSLDGGEQNFVAIMTGTRAALLFDRLKVGSLLTLSGICAADERYTNGSIPFALLLRSPDDIDVTAGPPWWTRAHVLWVTLGILLLLMMLQLLYSRVERWRLHAVLEERERLAHEMHDTLAQSFAGIGFQLQAVHSELANSSSAIRTHVELASKLVQQSHEEARRCITTLRPESLSQLGLLKALEQSANRMVQGGTMTLRATSSGMPQLLPVLVSDTLLRIGQEAIANSVRHAQATTISLSLIYGRNAVTLSIEDDGHGFQSAQATTGFGLLGMQERAAKIAATFTISSLPGCGTKVLVVAPVAPQFTVRTFPGYIWKYLKEHTVHGSEHTRPY